MSAAKRSVQYSRCASTPSGYSQRSSAKIELGRPRFGVEELAAQRIGLRVGGEVVGELAEELEVHLEERVVGSPALGHQLVHEPFEGKVLVGVSVERHHPHPRQQLAKGRISRQVGAQNWRIYKWPITPSTSKRLRLATGVPTTMSSCPV